jgi:hypothetical protein
MKKQLSIICAIMGLALCQTAYSQVVTTAVPFLLISPNSRAGGMGEAGVSLGDDAWAAYWNPAGYAFQRGTELAISHANWLPAFNLGDVWIAHAVYKQQIPQLDGTASLFMTYLNLGEFARTDIDPTVLETFKGYEFAIALGYGTKIYDDLGLGLNMRLIRSVLSPFGAAQEQGKGTATGFSFDMGLLYKPKMLMIPFTDLDLGDRLSLGVNISNIGPKIFYIDQAQADPIPMNLRLGFAYQVLLSEYNNFVVTTDVNRLLVKYNGIASDEFYKAFFTTWTGRTVSEQFRQFTTSFGAEYWYGSPKLIGLRFGYFYEDPRSGNRKYMTFGAGIRFQLYGFDFSYISATEDQNPLGGTLRFSLQVLWDEVSQ